MTFTFSCPGCCGDGGRYELECRTRSGSATLCGFPEFIPSSPPRYYLQANYGGSVFVERFSGEGFSCSGGETHDTVEMSGSGAKVWDPATCTLTDNAQLSYTLAFQSFPFPNETKTCIVSPGSSLGWGENACSSFLHLWGPASTRTQNKKYGWMSSDTGNAQCGCVSGSGNATIADCGSALTITLGSEDTEQAAMNRADPVWGEWGAVGCCTVSNTRTDRNLIFSQAEYRIRVAGTAGSVVNVVLVFSRSNGPDYEEIRQFVANGEDFGDWHSFQISSAPGHSTCLSRHYLYTI